ncbi:hypothetical protein M513_04355 [Trichuris suis]|uniref:HTH CENPB-type domain-containing protein n=1 Tax=Trichuris suis TaxID=68888 RepID=A0A085MBQ9_9BILA|nr:hypothetical protein M513_04355 [Trichuris suis]
MSQKHVPVDGRMIREKALSLYEHFGTITETPERKAFMAGKGWLASFVNRYNLKNLRVTGEAASADQESTSTFPHEFQRLVGRKGYLPEQVYNCDETALFWKKMPSRTYIHKDARQAMGFKAFKDRLTLVLCGNAAGHMIKPGVIYRACTPRPLKNKSKESFPVFWQHNRKAWMTAILFLEWLQQCFIPEVKSYLRAKGLPFKALLLIDNAPGHPQAACAADENVEVVFLPPNSTPLLQPLDQGIMKCVKATYTRLTFQRIRDALDANPHLSVTQSWKSFNIADAIILIAEAVQAIKHSSVNACWRPLWRNVVNDFKGFPSADTELENIRNIAMEIGGEGFSDMVEGDLREHLEDHRGVFSNQELEEMTKSSTDSEDDDAESVEQVQPPSWTLEKFADVFHQAQILRDKILEYDPSMERGLMVTRGITASLRPLQDLFDEAKKRQRQLPITMFLTDASSCMEASGSNCEDDQPSCSRSKRFP